MYSYTDKPCLQLIVFFELQMRLAKINPLPDDKILDLSELKQIADDNLKCI